MYGLEKQEKIAAEKAALDLLSLLQFRPGGQKMPYKMCIRDRDWQMVVSSAVVAGVVSVLTSVAGIPEVAEGK